MFLLSIMMDKVTLLRMEEKTEFKILDYCSTILIELTG